MKRALVLYHSLYGNTKSVAMSLAKGLEESDVVVTVSSIDDINVDEVSRYDLIVIGSPTHMLRPSKQMKEFLDRLKAIDLKELHGFSFDTRIESRMNRRGLSLLENSAARSLERFMKRKGMKIIKPRTSAIVEGREGPLATGAAPDFVQLGKEIGKILMI
jgi:flavodoxin